MNWPPDKVAKTNEVRAGLKRCNEDREPTSHEVLEAMQRYDEALERHVIMRLLSWDWYEIDDALLLALSAIPCTEEEARYVCILLASPKLGGRQSGDECDFCGARWKRGVASIVARRAGFLWPHMVLDATEVDEFVDRMTDFDWYGSTYSLKEPVRRALACVPGIARDVYCKETRR